MMELELMGLHEKNRLPLPETATLYQLLVQRGWVWKMSADYQAQAVAYINLGMILPITGGEKMNPKIRIVTKDGKIVKILTEGEIDVIVEDEKGLAAAYTSADLPDCGNRPGSEGAG